MPGLRLTKTSVEQAPAGARDQILWDDTLKGFGLKVTPTGRRIFLVQYRPKGAGARTRSVRRYTIGNYGAPWTVEKARAAATQILAKVRLGEDPFLSDKQARDREDAQRAAQLKEVEADRSASDRNRREAFGKLVAEFIERYARLKNRSVSETKRILNSDDVAEWFETPVSKITRSMVREVVDAASDRSRGGARLLFVHLRKFFNWCVESTYLDVSPCQGMKAPPKFAARDRWLTDDELRLVWTACSRLGEPFGPLFKVLILTAQRREEVASMMGPEVDLSRAEWVIPADRAKNGKAHAIDLSPMALKILADRMVGGGFLFSTTGKTAVSGYSGANRRLDALVETIRVEEALEKGLPPPTTKMPGWRVHDLRRTAATGMARLGHPPFVVEAVLNHISGVRGGLVAVYQHYDHRPERKAALLDWASHVSALVGGDPS